MLTGSPWSLPRTRCPEILNIPASCSYGQPMSLAFEAGGKCGQALMLAFLLCKQCLLFSIFFSSVPRASTTFSGGLDILLTSHLADFNPTQLLLLNREKIPWVELSLKVSFEKGGGSSTIQGTFERGVKRLPCGRR